jgi:MoaA/NifB/PqqE/SkfB family radical SAM enzyme
MLDNLLFKRARLFAKVVQCRILNKRKPVVAYLNITDRCNLRCRYCFVDVNRCQEELTVSEWESLINEIYLRGCRMICLMGGEPLLHPDIEEIVNYIRKKKIICDMTTNGVLVPQKINIVKNIDSLMVSLDGDEVAHDTNRGKGSFRKAINAIKIARQNNIVVRINAVMTKQSQGCLDFLLDLADEYNLYVTFSITAEFSCKDTSIAKEVALSDEEIRRIYVKLKQQLRKGRRILFSESTLDYVINYPLSYNKIIFRDDKENCEYYTEQCPFGRTMFYVDANGDFYPCAALWNTGYFSPRNLRKDGFQKAWDNMANLRCSACFCPGVPEWNRIMSLKGLFSGIKITLNQALKKNIIY